MTVDASAVARVLGITTEFKDLGVAGAQFLPQRIMVPAQGASAASYALTKFQASSSGDVGETLGFGSPAHLIARELFPDNGDGVGTIPVTFYPLEDDGSGVASTGTITPAGSQTKAAEYRVRVGGVLSAAFVIPIGATVAAITALIDTAVSAILEMPVTTTDNGTDIDLVSKWEGTSANGIGIEILGDFTLGTTFGIVQPAGGLVNPDIQPALDQVGEIWESMGVNPMEANDAITLDILDAFGEGRWGTLTHKPIMFFRGNTEADVNTSIATPSTRTADRTNVQLVAPGSVNLPFVVAARQVARIAKLANNNPPHDYGSQRATGLIPGADGDQWNYLERDQAVKGGSSTIEVKDGIVNVSDAVTSFNPITQPNPAYRFVVDVVKLQNTIFNMFLIFASEEWDGAPLIPDFQPTVNVTAKKPKMAKAALNQMIDSLALNAILADPESAKKKTTAVISSTNPKRLDATITVQLSGNTNIKDLTLNFGFFFGTATVVA